ncbi:MAG: protein kinase domain-containing protein [Pseudomonadota bacterium]
MDTAAHSVWIWLAVLGLGAAVGWTGIVLLSRWSERREAQRQAAVGPDGERLPSWAVPPPDAPAQIAAAARRREQSQEAGGRERKADSWADTLMVPRIRANHAEPLMARPSPPPAASGHCAPPPGDPADDHEQTAAGDLMDLPPSDAPRPAPDPASVTVSPHLQGLSLLAEGHFEAAWSHLKRVPAADPQSRSLLPALDRIASAFEGGQRFDLARAVLERMADIEPGWRDLKPRLLRARGLAQSMLTHPPLHQPGDAPPDMPRQIGRFVIDRELGRGAMGAVYLAHDPQRAAPVALKTLALGREFEGPDLAEARARFFREADLAGRLDHPGIVRIFDAGESDGLAYMAMELVHGVDLAAHAVPGKLLPVVAVLQIAAQVAEALAYAHSRGVTHRDIKPANIMVDFNTQVVKLMDFGIARIADAARTRTGMVLGTPSFMSPEQLAGLRVDGRSDLYSLGVTLFQLLTGRLPFMHDSMAALMRAIANEAAPDVRSLRPELPEALANAVALALEKRPEVRYADGLQMAADLRALALHLSDPAAGDNPAVRPAA